MLMHSERKTSYKRRRFISTNIDCARSAPERKHGKILTNSRGPKSFTFVIFIIFQSEKGTFGCAFVCLPYALRHCYIFFSPHVVVIFYYVYCSFSSLFSVDKSGQTLVVFIFIIVTSPLITVYSGISWTGIIREFSAISSRCILTVTLKPSWNREHACWAFT